MSKLEVEYWPIEDVKPYPENARIHSPDQIKRIAASMQDNDWTNPILIGSSGFIVAGHGRLEAAKEQGIDQVPVIQLKHLTATQEKAVRLSDNRLAQLAEWDETLLEKEIEFLRDEEYDLESIGFSDADIAALIPPTLGENDDDDVPEPPDEPISKVGDLWELGEHRILCGDSTNADDVAKVLDGATPNLMVTDPPYGVEYDAKWRAHSGLQNMNGLAHGKVSNDDSADWSEAWCLFPGSVIYQWASDSSGLAINHMTSLVDSGFEIRNILIWNKNQSPIGRGHYHLKHEPCLYAIRKGATADWIGDRKQHSVWDIDKPKKSETGHSTQKPVECMERPIRNHKGDVYEPFAGSGTTIIAATNQKRRCYAIELNPSYVDICVTRWENFTGKKANLA